MGFRLLILLTALLVSQPSLASRIYSYIDDNGQRVFTDQPPTRQHSGAPVKLPPINRLPATHAHPKHPTRPADSPTKTERPQVYSQLEIHSPAHDSTFLANERTIKVNVSSTPPLLPGHNYQIWLDGQPHGPSSQSISWQLEDIDRGTHSLELLIHNAEGEPLARSDRIEFHLRQTTLADRRRTRPCALEDYGKRHECPMKDKPEPKRRWWLLGL